MSVSVHVAAFISAMEAAGVGPAEPIGHQLLGGKLIRFRVVGDRPGRENGWAVYHGDGRPAGAFGCNKRQIDGKWKAVGPAQRLSPAERRERLQRFRGAEAARQREQMAAWEAAGARGQASWDRARPVRPVDERHPYLVTKAIVGEGLRQSGNLLLVPMCDARGRLWNLQLIDPEGRKRFLKGGRTAGLMFACGEPRGVICVGEGMATMAAVRRATGHAVVAAFSAKNLTPVATAMAETYPDCTIIICADDDAHLVDHPTIKRNLGLEAAEAAALAVGGRVAVPPRGNCHA